MSMLAEKKRSVKWQLNPRGKSLLENPNFGKQLLEKMGWKSGQGLGSKNQGPTDLIKVKLKNDSEGLGFKKTGDEWLKTTSEFNELLDRLSNDTAEESSDQNLESLEDRSKKSKARVHYHKYTRGKDLSRYSDKDLASIIGPDLMKQKNATENNSDYSSNQVNRGSSEDYFNKKKKDEISTKSNVKTDDNEENKFETEKSSQEIVNSSDVCKSKKKRKKSKEKNEQSMQYNENSIENETSAVVEKLKKKKSKNIDMKPIENDNNLDTVNTIVSETEKRCKRLKKRKHDEVVEGIQECVNSEQNIQDVDILSSNKKLKKNKDLNLSTADSVCDGSDKSCKTKKKKCSKISANNDVQEENTLIDLDNLSSKKSKNVHKENSTSTNVQMKELKKEKKKKKSKTIEDTTISAHKEEQNHDVSMVSEQLDTELEKLRNVTELKKKKCRKNKDAEDNALPRFSCIDNTYTQLESSNGNKNTSSNKVIVKGNIEKTSVIPQKIDLFTESQLVKHKLKTLGKPLPEVKVILSGEEILKKVNETQAAVRKQNLILYYSTDHWKSLLPKREVDEIKLVNILLVKRRFTFIGLVKKGLEQIEAEIASETKNIAVETPPKNILSQERKELFSSLLDRLNLLKQYSWDCTENLTLKKGEQGIADQQIIDKINQIFKKPYASDDIWVFSKIEDFILSNVPAFLETKLKRLTGQVDSLLVGNVPEELTRDSIGEDNAVLNNYNVQHGNYNNNSWRNPNINHSGRGGFASRRGQGGFQGSVSYRDHYSGHGYVQGDNFYFQNPPWNRGRGRGGSELFHRGSASLQESTLSTEARKENVQHEGAYGSETLGNDNAYDQGRGKEITLKITKNKKKKGKIFPSTGTHVRFEPLPQEAQPQLEVSHFNAPASFCHFGNVYRRGEGTFRGLLRGRVIQRGKISQNNYDARQYAEKCKALNKTPEISFNGVDLNKIPGYAASLSPSKPTTDTKS